MLADGSRPGRLTVGASRLGDLPPISGEGTVATVTFRALAAGPVRIAFGATQALDAGLKPVLPLRTEVASVRILTYIENGNLAAASAVAPSATRSAVAAPARTARRR